jgi:hypothetical protein
MGQKRRALHEERRERGQREIRHIVSRVLAAPLVGQGPAATAQGIEKAVLERHPSVESYFGRRGNQENPRDRRSRGTVASRTHPDRQVGVKTHRQPSRKPLKSLS